MRTIIATLTGRHFDSNSAYLKPESVDGKVVPEGQQKSIRLPAELLKDAVSGSCVTIKGDFKLSVSGKNIVSDNAKVVKVVAPVEVDPFGDLGDEPF